MNIKMLRKSITEGIRNGSITEYNKSATFDGGSYLLSGTRAFLTVDECEHILACGSIDYNDYQDHISKAILSKQKRQKRNIFSEPSTANGNKNTKSEGTNKSKNDEETEDVSVKSKSSLEPVSQGNNSNADYKLISDVGVKTLDEVKADLGVSSNDVEEKLNNLSQKVQTEYFDSLQKVNETVKTVTDKLKKQVGATKTISVKINNKVVTKKGQIYHPEFAKIVYYAKKHSNVLLVGSAGTGKTTLASQVADSLGLRFEFLACTAGMNESQILGRPTFSLDGKNGYQQSKFVDIFENGGVFLLDEYDALDANLACSVNSGLANGILSIPNRMDKPEAKRHKDCIVIACGNTWGTGQGSRQYSGRNIIDGATLDRFVPVKVDYDDNLERHLVGEHTALYDFLNHLRKACANKGLDKIISTRLFVRGAEDFDEGISFDGKTVLGTFADTMTSSWTKREKEKIDFDEIVAKYENQ